MLAALDEECVKTRKPKHVVILLPFRRSPSAGGWTDDQLSGLVREGMGHDGRTLFPSMPYQIYRYLSAAAKTTEAGKSSAACAALPLQEARSFSGRAA